MRGFLHIPILIAAVAAIAIVASVTVLGAKFEKGRPLDNVRDKICANNSNAIFCKGLPSPNPPTFPSQEEIVAKVQAFCNKTYLPIATESAERLKGVQELRQLCNELAGSIPTKEAVLARINELCTKDLPEFPEADPNYTAIIKDIKQQCATRTASLTLQNILLVPADRLADQRYKDGITNNIKKSQEFIANQLNGKTFSLNQDLRELKSTHPLSWFYGCSSSNDCPIEDDNWRHANEGQIWNKVVEDLKSSGLPVLAEKTLFAVFLLPGIHEFGTGSGFGLGPDTPDSQGLVILGDWKTAYAAGFDPPTDPDPSRCHQSGSLCAPSPALGAFIHEVGHALGLPHPESPSDQDISIMWSWWKYPDIGLTQKEKEQLIKNPAIK